MDTSSKNFRKDRSCEACKVEGAALASKEAKDFPRYLCETCMKLGLSHKMSSEEILILLEERWEIEANAKVDKCPRCGSDRILILSIDEERIFVRCGCTTFEGYKQGRDFRLG